jgi:hypothetical protein
LWLESKYLRNKYRQAISRDLHWSKPTMTWSLKKKLSKSLAWSRLDLSSKSICENVRRGTSSLRVVRGPLTKMNSDSVVAEDVPRILELQKMSSSLKGGT